MSFVLFGRRVSVKVDWALPVALPVAAALAVALVAAAGEVKFTKVRVRK